MQAVLQPIAVAAAVFVTAAALWLAVRGVGDLVGPAAPTVPELTPFTGGHAPTVHAWNRFHVRYYVVALVFLAFDMEMVFMYPWAVVFLREGAVALFEMGWFILVLLLGVLYAWRERALRWA